MNKLKAVLYSIKQDSLYRNSLLLILSTAIVSALGFLFWSINTRYFSADQIGLAASLISSTALLTNLSFLGFNNTLIRFLPAQKDKSSYVSTAILVTSIAALTLSTIFMLGLDTFASDLADKLGFWEKVTVSLYVVAAVVGAMLDSLFVSSRSAQVILFKNTFVSIAKLALPLAFVSLGFFGIFNAIAISLVAGTIVSAIFAYRRGIRFMTKIDGNVLKEVRTYASGNYLASIFGSMPATILPIMVVSVLGAKEAAYFYMPMMIATLLNVIPSSSCQSLFAEASHDQERMHVHIAKTFRSTMILLVPGALVIAVGGNLLLDIFGKEYSNQGMTILQLLALASIFGAINYMGDTVLNVRKQLRAYISMNLLNAILVLAACYFMMREWGLIGVGLGWLTGQVITVAIYLIAYGREELRLHRVLRTTSQTSA